MSHRKRTTTIKSADCPKEAQLLTASSSINMYSCTVAVLVSCFSLAFTGHIGVPPAPVPSADLKIAAATVVSSGTVPAVATGVSMPQYARSFTGMTGYPMFAALGDLSGYIRDQWENRNGVSVRGGYTIVRPDGSVIQIEYTSDPVSGFRVVVRRSGYPDWYPDSLILGSPLPGGYLPPFYSDLGYGYGSYYGYDDLDFDLDYGLGFLPSYYDGYGYDLYAPSFIDTYDFDLDFFKKRR